MESLESHTLNAFSKNIELTDHQKAVLKQIDEFTRTHLKEDGHAVFCFDGGCRNREKSDFKSAVHQIGSGS